MCHVCHEGVDCFKSIINITILPNYLINRIEYYKELSVVLCKDGGCGKCDNYECDSSPTMERNRSKKNFLKCMSIIAEEDFLEVDLKGSPK